ncbi:MAG: glycosyl hydrolase family 95 catalytic domain-containing protein [Anaerococcus sp.]
MLSKLTYNSPPNDWNEALPLGNGKTGAMVFGTPDQDRIQINEDSLWSGGFRERTNTLSKNYYKEIRELIEENKLKEAENLMEVSMWPYFLNGTHFQTAGDIWINYLNKTPTLLDKLEKDEMGIPRVSSGKTKIENYHRQLDLNKSEWSASYVENNHLKKMKCFISEKENVIIYKISGEKLNCVINYSRKDLGRGKNASYIDSIKTNSDDLIVAKKHNGSIENGLSFTVGIRVLNKNGKQESNGAGIVVSDAKEIVLVVKICTSFRHDNPEKYCIDSLNSYKYEDLEEIYSNHIKDAKKKLGNFSLKLTESDNIDLTTDQLLNSIKENSKSENIRALSELFVNYGRYLLLSSSIGDSLPSNLQGVWNKDLAPSWGSRYTLNINLQMNYSFALKMGLINTMNPLLEFINSMLDRGEKVAKEMYGLPGFVCHHTTDIWGDCAPQGQNFTCSVWPMGGAWISLYVWETYKYTRDKKILDKYYPILSENAEFLNSYLFKNKNNEWVTGPSASPENYYHRNNVVSSITNGPAIDIQIVKDLFNAYLEASKILGINNKLTGQVKTKYDELVPVKLNKEGKVMEWQEDYGQVDKGHRHLSHLYALHPSNQIKNKDTDLRLGAKLSLEERLKNGGGHTGWSSAWIVNLWNRLNMPENAYNSLCELFVNCYENLYSKHPPFQIDGNFGGTEGILQFFIQEDDNKILLLPSLPNIFNQGKIKNYHTSNGLTISFSWENGKVFELEAVSKEDGEYEFCLFENKKFSTTKYHFKKGEILKFNFN